MPPLPRDRFIVSCFQQARHAGEHRQLAVPRRVDGLRRVALNRTVQPLHESGLEGVTGPRATADCAAAERSTTKQQRRRCAKEVLHQDGASNSCTDLLCSSRSSLGSTVVLHRASERHHCGPTAHSHAADAHHSWYCPTSGAAHAPRHHGNAWNRPCPELIGSAQKPRPRSRLCWPRLPAAAGGGARADVTWCPIHTRKYSGSRAWNPSAGLRFRTCTWCSPGSSSATAKAPSAARNRGIADGITRYHIGNLYLTTSSEGQAPTILLSEASTPLMFRTETIPTRDPLIFWMEYNGTLTSREWLHSYIT
ncbi:uncharacterized protein LOC107200622 [Parus major]|uniref:uncharacterized protein LOC107200622 n=1 Tax=Parus major TaxID=9157 RepID=UPI0008F4E2AA|nr:uncharacterized protein LOC107200622 [Parus major]